MLDELLNAVEEMNIQPATVEELQTFKEGYDVQEAFKPGDLITVKNGDTGYNSPREGEPAIVLELIEPPVIFTRGLFRREDIAIGVKGPRGRVFAFSADSRYFKHYTPAEAVNEDADAACPAEATE